MKDLKEGVKHGITEMLNEKDKTNALIVAMDNFLKVAKEVGYVGLVAELEETKMDLQSYIVELNEQIELQKD